MTKYTVKEIWKLWISPFPKNWLKSIIKPIPHCIINVPKKISKLNDVKDLPAKLGENAGAIHFIIYIFTSIVLTLAQPAVAMKFPTSLAGKSLTSFNLLIFLGTFIMQWGIGLIIDLSQFLGRGEIQSFQISFFVYLVICILCYLYFILNNKNG